MLQTKHFSWALMLAVGVLIQPLDARAQSTTQPTPEGFALYDQLAPSLMIRSGLLPLSASPDNAELGCQRYGQIASVIIRFALSTSLASGQTLDGSRAENRRQAAEQVVDEAQTTIGQVSASGATTEQCGGVARSFGAAAFSLALSINPANVQRNAQAFLAANPAPKPPDGQMSADELAADEAARADADRLAEQKAGVERLAAEKIEHAFANLGTVAPAPAAGRAQPLSFNIYLIDTPAMREAKDFRLCFEPALYQRAAKPLIDLASAALEVPEAAPVIDQAAVDFLDKLRAVVAARFKFPADRLVAENDERGAVRGPVAEPVKAMAAGCHVYLATRVPLRAHDDGGTTFGLLAENVIEDAVIRPALDVRFAALPKLEALLRPAVVASSETDAAIQAAALANAAAQASTALAAVAPTTEVLVVAAPVVSAPAPVIPANVGARPEIARCVLDTRCRAAARVAINACLQTAERRNGKADIARQLEARQQATARFKSRSTDEQAARDLDLVTDNLELINNQLGQSLERLQADGARLRQAARDKLSPQELDAAATAGRDEGEQSMGTPTLSCFSRIADGRATGLVSAQ
ncbi:MAG: hypothetical protein WDO24_10420 [Pseudomonadota bacterium]